MLLRTVLSKINWPDLSSNPSNDFEIPPEYILIEDTSRQRKTSGHHS